MGPYIILDGIASEELHCLPVEERPINSGERSCPEQLVGHLKSGRVPRGSDAEKKLLSTRREKIQGVGKAARRFRSRDRTRAPRDGSLNWKRFSRVLDGLLSRSLHLSGEFPMDLYYPAIQRVRVPNGRLTDRGEKELHRKSTVGYNFEGGSSTSAVFSPFQPRRQCLDSLGADLQPLCVSSQYEIRRRVRSGTDRSLWRG